MANEDKTLYADGSVLAAALDAEMVPAFQSAAIMPALVSKHNLGANPKTRTKLISFSGSVTASVIAEATPAAAQKVTDTQSPFTIQKAVVVTAPTIEAEKFGNGADPARHAMLHGQACAKKYDIDAMAKFSGFSQSVDCGDAATVAGLLEAAYVVGLADVPVDVVVAVIAKKQAFQISSDIRSNTGAFYGNPNFNPNGAEAGREKRPGFIARLFDIDVYSSNNVPVDASATPDDNVGGVFNPQFAIAALYPDEADMPVLETSIDNSVGFLASIKYIKTLMWYQLGELLDTAGCQFISHVVPAEG